MLAFLGIGTAVYHLTAAPADPGKPGFSLGALVAHIQSAIKGEHAEVTVVRKTVADAPAEGQPLSLSGFRGRVTVIAEERDDIEAELKATAFGVDDATAQARAEAIKLELTPGVGEKPGEVTDEATGEAMEGAEHPDGMAPPPPPAPPSPAEPAQPHELPRKLEKLERSEPVERTERAERRERPESPGRPAPPAPPLPPPPPPEAIEKLKQLEKLEQLEKFEKSGQLEKLERLERRRMELEERRLRRLPGGVPPRIVAGPRLDVIVKSTDQRVMRRPSFELTLRVPMDQRVSLSLRGGEAEVRGVSWLTLDEGRGKLTILDTGRVDGVHRGEISAERIETATIEVSRGEVRFNDVSGPLEIKAEHADLTLSKIAGPVKLATQNLDCKLEEVEGPVRIDSEHTNIDVRDPRAAVTIKGSDSEMLIAMTDAVDVSIENTGDTIEVRLPKHGVRVDAEAIEGEIRTTHPHLQVASEQGKQRVVAKVDGGGPLIKLRNEHGHIVLR